MNSKPQRTKEENRNHWDCAIGMSKVDGGEPSPELLALIEKEINGEITMDDILNALNKKYKKSEKDIAKSLSGNDPYLQDNGTLKNKLGITDPKKLKQAEIDFSTFRIKELRDESI
ncbi:hypothetical protein LJC34_01995 [Oscillospiraceae bacterium OttesenSCG-928-G22]|nr:hypothetical protein [Oscillospiraceae bacterium OttesenSCG-928-G22]